MTFTPLLGHDVGEYICSVMVTGFKRIENSKSVMVMVNGMSYVCTKCIDCILSSYIKNYFDSNFF